MITESKETIDGLAVKVNSLQSHQRYLDNLLGTNATDEEDGTCIVCRFVTAHLPPPPDIHAIIIDVIS